MFYDDPAEGVQLKRFRIDKYVKDVDEIVKGLAEGLRSYSKGTQPLDDLEGAGSEVLKATTWDLKNVIRNSRNRTYLYAAKCAVVEHVRVRIYRKKMVEQTGVGLLRRTIAQALGAFTEGVIVGGVTRYEYVFWD